MTSVGESLSSYLARTGKREHTTQPIRLGPWEDREGSRDPYKRTARGGVTRAGRPERVE